MALFCKAFQGSNDIFISQLKFGFIIQELTIFLKVNDFISNKCYFHRFFSKQSLPTISFQTVPDLSAGTNSECKAEIAIYSNALDSIFNGERYYGTRR